MSAIVLHLPTVNFRKKSKSSQQDVKINPVVVDFGRLLKSTSKNLEEVIPGIPNTDLLHATASLFGISLSEVTDDVIYPVLCEKWSKSILMILDEPQAKEKLRSRMITMLQSEKGLKVTSTEQSRSTLQDKRDEIKQSEENDRFVDIFSDEEESEEEDTVGEEANFMDGLGDFLKTVDRRREVRKRWLEKHRLDVDSEASPLLGVENRLIGCATFERSYERPGEKVIQLTLVAVRRKYRGLGIGSYFIKQLLDPTITGGCDVIVVNADHNAIEFFERHGFTDDAILNSRYAHIGDVWFNSKRMCYLSGFAHAIGDGPPDAFFSLREMELEISMWKEKSVQAYQQFASIVYRMRREILTLHARVALQDETIARLQRDRRSVDVEEAEMRKRIGNLRDAIDSVKEGEIPDSYVTSSSALDVTSTSTSKSHDSESLLIHDDVTQDDAECTSKQVDDITLLAKFADGDFELIPAKCDDNTSAGAHTTWDGAEAGEKRQSHCNHDVTLEHEATSLQKSSKHDDGTHPLNSLQPPSYIPPSALAWPPDAETDPPPITLYPSHSLGPPASTLKEDLDSLFLHEIKHCFLTSFADRHNDVVDVHDVTGTTLPLGVMTRFNDAVTSSHDPDVVATLYYCDATERCGDSKAFKQIMDRGFRADDFVQSEYGKGLHFSRHARCATHFSPSGYIIVAKVCLGRTQTVTSRDPNRHFPPEGFDSVLTQGRFSAAGARHGVTTHSEYIVFQPHQAIPVAMVEFSLQY